MPTGTSVAYVAGDGHIQIPLARDGYRAAHAPPKPTGLDWGAITPKCHDCGRPSGELDRDDRCPACTTPQAPVEATSTPASTGNTPKKRRGRKPTVDRPRIVELYALHQTAVAVRAETGYAIGTITRVLKEEGITIRGNVKVRPEDHQTVVDHYQAGEEADDIAAAFGCSRSLVYAILKDAGVPRRARPPKPRQPRAPRAGSVDRDRIVRLYTEGSTIPEIRGVTGNALGTIRGVLLERGVVLRDDRKGHSGSQPKDYPAELVAAVRRCYIDQQMTIAATADELGTTAKVIGNVMRRHGIEARPDASQGGLPGVDRSVGLKQQIADLGVTAREIKEWALRAGLILEIAVGLPSARIVAAYAEAHQMQEAS